MNAVHRESWRSVVGNRSRIGLRHPFIRIEYLAAKFVTSIISMQLSAIEGKHTCQEAWLSEGKVAGVG